MLIMKVIRLEVEVMGKSEIPKQLLKLAISSKYIHTLWFSIPIV